MKIILVGYGNVGKELANVLNENEIPVDFIIRSSGIYASDNIKIDDLINFENYIDSDSFVFISVPSKGNGSETANYYLKSLNKGARIITCEKAFTAHNWGVIKKFKGQIRYSATVGGGSGMLNAISEYIGEIKEIKAVVNGTLNYIGDKLARGATQAEVYAEVIKKGYAEPGAKSFDEVIKNELSDVVYKTVILANHSKMYQLIINPIDIILEMYQKGLRSSVVLNKNGIQAGFLPSKDYSWFPQGVNNVLYVNGQKVVEGPGAGARITAERMFEDYKQLVK
jgi:homoserine dehydrogenase